MKHIKVHVYDDGDTELTLLEASHSHKFISNDLIFTPTEIGFGALEKELISYGFDSDRAREAIDECLKGQPGEEVSV